MNKLNKYWNIIKCKSGVLYLMGRPGEAKTAIIEKIANDNDLNFIDIRLSQMDETDIGLFPFIDNGIVKHGVPAWAVEANEKPTLIFFDELNRSRESVRNAALQILNERKICGFKFNETVYMCAAGNLGDEDGTSVDEFDSALWNRLIPIRHELTIDEWVVGFAKENVWDMIVSFIQSHPENFYRSANNNDSKQYATPRSWTFLSNYVKTNYGESFKVKDVIKDLKEIGYCYVGNSITPFIRYLEDMSSLNITDVIDRYPQIQNQVKQLSRSQLTELITSLKEYKVEKFTKTQYENVVSFLTVIHPDERVSYIMNVLDVEVSDKKKTHKNVASLLKTFNDDIAQIKSNFGL